MTTCETSQSECPECSSKKMFVTEGFDSDRGNFVDHYCPECEYSNDQEDGDVDQD